jgi:hypothetical protein
MNRRKMAVNLLTATARAFRLSRPDLISPVVLSTQRSAIIDASFAINPHAELPTPGSDLDFHKLPYDTIANLSII